MKRRQILQWPIASLPAFSVLAAASNLARAQPSAKVYRVAHLSTAAIAEQRSRDIVLGELARLGFKEGVNLVFDGRVGSVDQLPELMRLLLAARPDVVIAVGGAAVNAAAAATRTVPIAMFADAPVTLGYAENYARPGGNVTGVANMLVELHGKRLTLLLEVVPDAQKIAAFVRADDPSREPKLDAMRSAARQAGITLSEFSVRHPSEYPEAFARMQAAGVRGVVIAADPEFNRDEAQLSALATRHGLASTCEWASMARAGCLIGYGPQARLLRVRLAQIVARILHGASPADLPIEQASQFDLALNLATARALAVNIPPSLLIRADEIID